MKSFCITDDVTLSDAINYANEIYDPAIIDSYIDSIDTSLESR